MIHTFPYDSDLRDVTYAVLVWGRLFDFLGWPTGIKVPVLMGAGRETCWYTVELKKVAVFAPIDYGVSESGAMVSIGGVKIRSTDCHIFLSWSSYAPFAVLLS